MYYVYLIKSISDAQLYIGSTKDLRKRMVLHQNNKISSTKYRSPFELIYYEAFKEEGDAREREKQLKNFGKAYSLLKKRIKRSLDVVQSVC